MNIVMQYGNGGTAVNYVWIGLAGSAGATGTVTVAADGNGSMQVTVPIAANSPGIYSTDYSLRRVDLPITTVTRGASAASYIVARRSF